ncbi:MAG: M42 family peptidase, partial [Ruminococcus sp.]|nr:M42 family peptidase [Ruminococcus sp.]
MINVPLLKRLCMTNGISGDEGAVRELIIEEIKGYADYKIDALGNLLVHKKGKKPAQNRLMLSAHMDEVGMMVTDVTAGGFLKFDEVGGIDRRVLIGKQVTVGKNNVPGVIGIKPIHLCKGEEHKTIPEYSEMTIDIGADSAEQALEVVGVGDSVQLVSEFIETETHLNAKAIDDRFGCYVMIELIKSDLEYDADFAFVVQEEVGLRGSKTAAYTLDPAFA